MGCAPSPELVPRMKGLKLRPSHLLLSLPCLLLLVPQFVSAQFVVTETDDAFDYDVNDGVCAVCRAFDNNDNCVTVGGCTFHAAIQNANLDPDRSTISFGVLAVSSTTNTLPTIIYPVTIDGAFQGGRAHVAGPGPTPNAPGILVSGISTSGSVIRNLEVSGFPTGIEFRNSDDGAVTGSYIHDNSAGSGLLVSGSSRRMTVGGPVGLSFGDAPGNVVTANGRGIQLVGNGGNTVYGNRIGIDKAGAQAGNVIGIVVVDSAAAGSFIGSGGGGTGNAISNSQFDGIAVSGSTVFGGPSNVATGLTIRGNEIGTGLGGELDHGNTRGITLTRTEDIVIRDNTIGGNGDGIWLNGRADSTLVTSNSIGYSIFGGIIPNGNGIVVRDLATRNVISGNTISGNTESGILVTKVNLSPSRNFIDSNTIGLSGLGDPVGNGYGIRIVDADSNYIGLLGRNTIAANDAGVVIEGGEAFGNVISGNDIGVFDQGNLGSGVGLVGGANHNRIESNSVVGNFVSGISLVGVGTSANIIAGNTVAGHLGAGIMISDEAAGNTVGGTGPADGNSISYNFIGVVVVGAAENSILGNIMERNRIMPIELGMDFETPNDILDADVGANTLQNYPEINEAVIAGGSTIVNGALNSVPNSDYRIEFFEDAFENDAIIDASFFMGSVDVTTDANGVGEFEFTFIGEVPEVVVTATDGNGNTSEFGYALTTGAELSAAALGDSLATPGTQKDVRVSVSSTGQEDVESVQLSISSSDNLSLVSILSFPDSMMVNCPGDPAICLVGDMPSGTSARFIVSYDVSPGAEYRVEAKATGVFSQAPIESNLALHVGPVATGVDGVEDRPGDVPTVVALGPAYPNPFSRTTTVPYTVGQLEAVDILVFDLLGRLIRNLPTVEAPGQYVAVWDGKTNRGHAAPAGVYFIRLRTGGDVATRSVVLVR